MHVPRDSQRFHPPASDEHSSRGARGLQPMFEATALRTLILLAVAPFMGCSSDSVPADNRNPTGPATQVLVKDQGNRTGNDWPAFLGPLGTSVSTEKRIISPWPKEGLKVLWHRKLGIGYAMP